MAKKQQSNLSRAKEIRLQRRALEKKKPKKSEMVSIVTDFKPRDEYTIPNTLDAKAIHQQFEAKRDEYLPRIRSMVISQLAISTSIENVFKELSEILPDSAVAEGVHAAVDSAWDLASSGLLLELAFQAQGYDEDASRVFAQAVLLKKTEAPPPVDPKKKQPPKPDIDGVVEAVTQELHKYGLVLSRAKKKEGEVPQRKQGRS